VPRTVNTSGCSSSCCNIPAVITETCCSASICSTGCCESLWSPTHESEQHQYLGHRTSILLQFMNCNVKRWFDYVELNSRHQLSYTKSELCTCKFLLLRHFNSWRWAYYITYEQETITQCHGITSLKNRVISCAYGPLVLQHIKTEIWVMEQNCLKQWFLIPSVMLNDPVILTKSHNLRARHTRPQA
jgi:hypothetical protein